MCLLVWMYFIVYILLVSKWMLCFYILFHQWNCIQMTLILRNQLFICCMICCRNCILLFEIQLWWQILQYTGMQLILHNSSMIIRYIIYFQALTKHARFVRDLVREITGFAPYERRMQELLRIQKDKRALKFAKRRVRQLTIMCFSSVKGIDTFKKKN